ncbi:hypothetical protein FH972_026479 [Carpinus fangiana]|uniref:Transcription initiation factor TFIID subunit 8 n=1 Tax=Carpinus fangiana TaxID=176857 RepID=A0A5N6L4E9_9ROSI|nr:hypothetical protein FH972_026479 [Carpinus fangiana]
MSSKRPADTPSGDIPQAKKARTGATRHHTLKYKQPGALLPLALPQDGSIIEQELSRSLCVALHAAGFDSVRTDALESFRAHVDSYMTNFSLWVNHSMRHARRTQPIPEDFAMTLARLGLTPTSLTPDLKLPVPADITQRPISASFSEPVAEEARAAAPMTFNADTSLSGAVEKRRKTYIPKHFPDFPSQHTYKDTAVLTQRESDARKLREQSTQEGMLAEQALRRLMAARQRGSRSAKEHSVEVHVANKIQKESEAVFQEALAAMAGGDAKRTGEIDALDSFSGADAADGDAMGPTDIDFGAIVNHDRINWRKGAADWLECVMAVSAPCHPRLSMPWSRLLDHLYIYQIVSYPVQRDKDLAGLLSKHALNSLAQHQLVGWALRILINIANVLIQDLEIASL